MPNLKFHTNNNEETYCILAKKERLEDYNKDRNSHEMRSMRCPSY